MSILLHRITNIHIKQYTHTRVKYILKDIDDINYNYIKVIKNCEFTQTDLCGHNKKSGVTNEI